MLGIQVSIDIAGFREYFERLQLFAIWLIECASNIGVFTPLFCAPLVKITSTADLDDEQWKFFLAFACHCAPRTSSHCAGTRRSMGSLAQDTKWRPLSTCMSTTPIQTTSAPALGRSCSHDAMAATDHISAKWWCCRLSSDVALLHTSYKPCMTAMCPMPR